MLAPLLLVTSLSVLAAWSRFYGRWRGKFCGNQHSVKSTGSHAPTPWWLLGVLRTRHNHLNELNATFGSTWWHALMRSTLTCCFNYEASLFYSPSLHININPHISLWVLYFIPKHSMSFNNYPQNVFIIKDLASKPEETFFKCLHEGNRGSLCSSRDGGRTLGHQRIKPGTIIFLLTSRGVRKRTNPARGHVPVNGQEVALGSFA